MLATYPGADGLKTGYTNASGFNLVHVRDARQSPADWCRDGRQQRFPARPADGRTRWIAASLTAEATSVSAWTSPREPPSARFSAANFGTGLRRPRGRARQRRSPRPSRAGRHRRRLACHPLLLFASVPRQGGCAAPAAAPHGGWVIQIGSFSDPRTAQAALERASGALPSRSAPMARGDFRRRGAGLPGRPAPGPVDQPLSQERPPTGCKQASASARSPARRSRSPPGGRQRADHRRRVAQGKPCRAGAADASAPMSCWSAEIALRSARRPILSTACRKSAP